MWVCIYIVGLWWPFLCAMCYCCLCFISLSRFVMPLLPTTDSRLFLRVRDSRLCVRLMCEWIMWVCLYFVCVLFLFAGLWWPCVLCVIIVCVLFLLVGLWWPSFQQQIRAFFLPRSWLAFVCKIDEWMNYVSIFIFCLCFISLCRFVMVLLVWCMLLLSVFYFSQ